MAGSATAVGFDVISTGYVHRDCDWRPTPTTDLPSLHSERHPSCSAGVDGGRSAMPRSIAVDLANNAVASAARLVACAGATPHPSACFHRFGCAAVGGAVDAAYGTPRGRMCRGALRTYVGRPPRAVRAALGPPKLQ
jgi:hypothetical protein